MPDPRGALLPIFSLTSASPLDRTQTQWLSTGIVRTGLARRRPLRVRKRAPQYLFLPIRPRWALAILEGSKRWELRTRRPSVDSGDVVVLYATSPLRAVVGSFMVGEIISGDPLS